jgi:hypothetical protein
MVHAILYELSVPEPETIPRVRLILFLLLIEHHDLIVLESLGQISVMITFGIDI